MYDVLIIGGGAAGLSAALILGRCSRRVLVCDHGVPRNQAARALHGFLSRDGVEPHELIRVSREQLTRYENVQLLEGEVTDARRVNGNFEIELHHERRHRGRTLLLATGMVDTLPDGKGFESFYGKSVFHCPYCDAWEVRDWPLAVYGRGERAFNLSNSLFQWSKDIILFSDGPSELTDSQLAHLNTRSIVVCTDEVVTLSGDNGVLQEVVLVNSLVIKRRALFFTVGRFNPSPLASRLGCVKNKSGEVETNGLDLTNIPGLFAAGDVVGDVQFVIVAAADGAKAAVGINKYLTAQEAD